MTDVEWTRISLQSMIIKIRTLIHGWTASAKSIQGLLNRYDIDRQLRQNTLQDIIVDIRIIRRRFDGVIGNHISTASFINKQGLIPKSSFGDLHAIIKIEQPVRGRDYHARSPNARQDHRVNTLRTQDLLQRVAGTSIISGFLEDDITRRTIHRESGIQLSQRIRRRAQHPPDLGEGALGPDFRLDRKSVV